jgi:hypothetical protein
VVWIESKSIPDGVTFIDRDAVFAEVFASIAAEWNNFTAEVDEIFSANRHRVVTQCSEEGDECLRTAVGRNPSWDTGSQVV